ncbi:MAG: hypothetical protein IJL71_06435, partial [Oscillospiraceae bacterium]|nr:hypothetical protein [Oscillospiraceae bacterium]
MRRKGTKILSFLLVLVMAFSLLPVSALAEGETGTDATTTQPRSGYMFTESPSGTVYIDPETLEWHITWTTSFVPSRVDLVKTVDGVDSAIMLGISEPGMTQSYDIQAYHGSGSYRLRAYTGQDDNSVYSSSFTLDISNLLFLSSPMDNGYDPDTLKCHIVWTTNFVPARMGLVKIEGETERETTPGITEPGLTQSYDIFAYNGSGDYYLKAYTSRDTTCRDCVRSQVFHVNDSALRFTVQPQGGTFD